MTLSRDYICSLVYPRESEGICFHRRCFVCMSVCLCAIDWSKAFDKVNHHALFIKLICTKFMLMFIGGKGKQVRVSLRSIEGVEVTVKKTTIAFAGDVLSQSTFYLVYFILYFSVYLHGE